MARSLRTTLLVGLMTLGTVMTVGFAGVVYWRADRQVHDALHADLKLRAMTLAGILSIEREGIEFELAERALPEYYKKKSGVYATIHDHTGKLRIRSLNLTEKLEPSTPWRLGALDYEELTPGPDGIPCAAVTYSFIARLDAETSYPGTADDDGEDDADDADDAWVPPTEAERQYQARVAVDSRPRDESLAQLALFLFAAGAGTLLVIGVGGLLIARRVMGPIESMTDEAKGLTPRDETRRLAVNTVVAELQSLASQFNLALDRQSEALESQRRFTADASHELRTPVAVLRGNAELLLRRKRTVAEYREGLETQVRVASRMQDVIQNLLVLARSDSSGEGLRLEDLSLGGLVESLCRDYKSLAGEREITLHCDSPQEVRATCDRRAIETLVQNLVSNAIKFTPAGGRVDVVVGESDGHVSLDVSDSGPGIPDEHRQQVFERFYRVESGSSRCEGAGLGLAIVASVALAHGGEVTVRDSASGGATFAVRLPARRSMKRNVKKPEVARTHT